MGKTQYNPNVEIDRRLIAAGASKTIYALVMPEIERVLIETLLQRFGVQELPQKYATVQERAAEKVSAQFNLPIKPADVMLIGNVPEHLFLESSPDMASYLTRPGVERNEPIRLCLTPGMAELIEPTAPHRRMAETSEHGMPGP